MDIPPPKRHEYWNHFIERWALEHLGGDLRITAAKLKHLKPFVFQDDVFWTTVIFHHQGHHHTPEELCLEDKPNYLNCQQSFWRMISEALFRHDLLP